MHPLFAHRNRITFLYLVAWVAGGTFVAGLMSGAADVPFVSAVEYAVPLALVYGFLCLSAWWVCRATPVQGTPPLRLFRNQVGAAASVSALWTLLGAVWAIALGRLAHVTIAPVELMRRILFLFMLGIPVYLASAVVHYLFLAFDASHVAERRLLETEVSARESELRALRAQLDPHFLFNSLNSINALVGTDPEGARRMCELLGDFMRRTLTLGAKSEVTLAEELSLVERYLEIEQVRFGDRLRVVREIDPATTTCLVPPLLLQPLVENAVKHGVARRVDGGTIRLAAHRANGRLGIVVENPVDPDAPPKRGQGVGLENVRRRLQAFRARETTLQAWLEGTRFRVEVSLPASEALTTGESPS